MGISSGVYNEKTVFYYRKLCAKTELEKIYIIVTL